VALDCQRLHQNNPKSGNFASLVRVFCKLATQVQHMTDNHLVLMHTANALLLVRTFAKYLVEVDSEQALLDQLCPEHSADSSTSTMVVNELDEVGAPEGRSGSQDLSGSEAGDVRDQVAQDNHPLVQLIRSVLQLCISVPVE
jgi:hypothetical protein